MENNTLTPEIIARFISEQLKRWPMAASNYRGLEQVKERRFFPDGICIKVQFNPERIRSSAAKVDARAIAERPCFLCDQNRPAEQKTLSIGHNFQILLNPFPIFRQHLTISSTEHTPQRLFPNIDAMLSIAAQLEGFTVFYNGPECGASAPDHLHFQAGENNFMPVDEEFALLKPHRGKPQYTSKAIQVWTFDSYLRKMISIQGTDQQEVRQTIERIYNQQQQLQPEKEEPMLNVLCSYANRKWTVHLFPRRKHRPRQFFEEGEKQLLISPASVDFGGVFIVPRQEDFEKITEADIRDIFSQLTMEAEAFKKIEF